MVINKYVMFFRKKCPQCKTLCVYYCQGDLREPKITFIYLINGVCVCVCVCVWSEN